MKLKSFLSARELDSPVNLERAAGILADSALSKDRQAECLLCEIDGATYDAEKERRNAVHAQRRLQDEGSCLTVGRFGRASYFLLLLAAAARTVDGARTLAGRAKRIAAACEPGRMPPEKSMRLIFDDCRRGLLSLQGAAADLQRLCSAGAEPMRAELKGAALEIRRAAHEVQAELLRKIDDFAGTRRGIGRGIGRLRKKITSIAENVLSQVDGVEAQIDAMPGRHVNFSVLVQRPSITGVVALNRIRAGLDPFESAEGLIAEILREGGERTYGSGDDVWFEVAQVWIEALPLFIHEEDVKSADGRVRTRVVIEQDSMELAIRRLAPRWKRNIDEVMDSEHIALARRVMIQAVPALKGDLARRLENSGGSEDDCARDVIVDMLNRVDDAERHAIERRIATLAALIELSWRNLRHEVAQAQEDGGGGGVTRYAALNGALDRDQSEGNVLRRTLEAVRGRAGDPFKAMDAALYQAVEREDKKLERGNSTFRIRGKSNDLIRSDMIRQKRRTIPTWIILTTQAAGMSDAFAGHWLDEEMSLCALTCGLAHDGKSLDEQARKVLADEETVLAEIGERVIREFQLDYLLVEQSEPSRTKRVLSLIRSYTDVAEEVSKIRMIFETLPRGEQAYGAEPAPVEDYLRRNGESLERLAINRVIEENAELKTAVEGGSRTKDGMAADDIYGAEVKKYARAMARDRVIDDIEARDADLGRMIRWYAYAPAGDRAPNLLRFRLAAENGLSTARKEIIARFWMYDDGAIEVLDRRDPERGGSELFRAINDPLYAYACRGRNKKYNRGYGPSRVDLGPRERLTTETYTQWIGPADRYAKDAMKRFYRMYNFDVRAYDDVREAEEMKPLENTLMEAGLAVTHLLIPLFQAIGVGNFLKLIFESNLRPETFTRAGGAGSAGFCQPKDIYFLGFVTTVAVREVYEYAGIPISQWPDLQTIQRRVAGRLKESGLNAKTIASMNSDIDSVLTEGREKISRAEGTRRSFLLDSGSATPPLDSIRAFSRFGRGDVSADPERAVKTLVAGWHNDVLEDMESRIRFAPLHAILILRSAFACVRSRRADAPSWAEAIVTLPMEYKPVSDPRLSAGLRMLEYMAGTAGHLMRTFDADGRALARFVLRGFDPADDEMGRFLAERFFQKNCLDDTDRRLLAEQYRPVVGPLDIRMVSPFNLAAESVYNYVSGNGLRGAARDARRIVADNAGIGNDVIDANACTFGADLARWEGIRDMPVDARCKLIADIGARAHVLVLDARLQNPEYRSTCGSDLWESIRGADVFSTIVHYEDVTGSEDEGADVVEPGVHGRMIDDLPRIRDVMRDGRAHSAVIWFDAPVQGRKPCADLIAIKQWLALGGWYASPTVSEHEIIKLQRQMAEDRDLTSRLVAAFRRRRFDEALHAYDALKTIAADRYEQARREEKYAVKAARWWRGGGFQNASLRHRAYSEAWGRLAQGLDLKDIDIGTLLAVGLMYRLNGLPEKEISSELRNIDADMAACQKRSRRQRRSRDSIDMDVVNFWVKPRYDKPPDHLQLEKGVSSSIKRREETAERAGGRALAYYLARRDAISRARRRAGVESAQPEIDGLDVDGMITAAYIAIGSGESISDEEFGRMIAFAGAAYRVMVDTLMVDAGLKQAMIRRCADALNFEQNSPEETWAVMMGRGDDIGDIGRLSMAAGGRRKELYRLADLGGLLDAVLALNLTLPFALIEDADIARMHPERRVAETILSDQVMEAVQRFFDMTVYDHTFDYLPAWMHPAKSGLGFTDYDTIMGRWLGEGKPYRRQELIELAVRAHRPIHGYLDRLIRTRTWLKDRDPESFVNPILGGAGWPAPIGVACASFTESEAAWWTYTQIRELAFLDRQGHRITGVFPHFDAGRAIDGNARPAIAVHSPIGRPHLTCFLQENPAYNRNRPARAVNLVLTRACDFVDVCAKDKNVERLMLIPNGLMYLDRETYVTERAIQIRERAEAPDDAQATREAEAEADEALARNPKGIAAAVRFRTPLINCFSMPFHGSEYYIEGEDEAIGLPTSQAWIHNLTPGYSKGEGSKIYAGKNIYPFERHWLKNRQYAADGKSIPIDDVVEKILNGDGEFEGIRRMRGWWLISKPYRQSGGRGAIAARIRAHDGSPLDDDMRAFARSLADQGYRDDQVIQKFVSSTPYLWASPELIDLIRRALIRKGIAAPAEAPLFVYSRIIVVYDGNSPSKLRHALELIVSSRMAVSNVGLGGVLFKWRVPYAAGERVAKKLMSERRMTADVSMGLIEKRARTVWNRIMSGSDAAGEDSALFNMKERLARASRRDRAGEPRDRTGWPYARPRFIMHDLLDVPVVRLEDGGTITAPDILDVKFTADGRLDRVVILDDRKTGAWHPVTIGPENIAGWKSIKIEDNIGYGLWFPYSADEERHERESARQSKREPDPAAWGGDLRKILGSFADAAWAYRESLPPVEMPAAPMIAPAARVASTARAVGEKNSDALSRAIETAKARAGRPSGALTEDAVSVALKWYIIYEMEGRQSGTNGAALAREIVLRNLNGLISKILKESGETIVRDELSRWLHDPDYIGAVGRLVDDHAFTQPAAPELQIVPNSRAWDSQRWTAFAGGRKVHALLFDEFPGILDEIYPLVRAASSAGCVCVASRMSWLNLGSGSIQRLILYMPDTDELKEMPLRQPVVPDRIQTLGMGQNELESHARLSARFHSIGIPSINTRLLENGTPLSAAAVADDKFLTTRSLQYLVEVPTALRLESTDGAATAVRKFVDGLIAENTRVEVHVRVQPNLGTEGRGHAVHAVLKRDLKKWSETAPLMKEVLRLMAQGEPVLVREEVGNARVLREAGQCRVTIRVFTSFAYPGSYTAESGYAIVGKPGSAVASVEQGGGIYAIRDIVGDLFCSRDPADSAETLKPARLTDEDIKTISQAAVAAHEALNLCRSPQLQLYFTGVDIELEFHADGKLAKCWVLDVNPRPCGLRHADRLIAGGAALPDYANLWKFPPAGDDIPPLILKIVREDLDESHAALLKTIPPRDEIRLLTAASNMLHSYLALRSDGSSDPKLLLKQQRAAIIMGDVLLRLLRLGRPVDTGTADTLIRTLSSRPETQALLMRQLARRTDVGMTYAEFIRPFLECANEKELEDFRRSAGKILTELSGGAVQHRFIQPERMHISEGPMRLGISSANASDNHTGIKLRGGVVLNMAIDIDRRPPVRVEITRLPRNVIELESDDSLPVRLKSDRKAVFTRATIGRFLTFDDPADPLRLLKYSLIFTRIVGYGQSPETYKKNPQLILDDIAQFTGGGGLRIRLINRGPARSGFASSSAVSVNLLNALYHAMGRAPWTAEGDPEFRRLGTLAVLFENELGLKSGRQDTDGQMAGVKSIQYAPTDDFPLPDTKRVTIDHRDLAQRLIAVDSGIRRSGKAGLHRGLNVRHLAYLTRHPRRFWAIRKSFGVHGEILEAVRTGNWRLLGRLFLDYMRMRETIDPGATQSVYDTAAGEKILRKLFDPLIAKGVIFGGMFTGAMGGGVAILVAAKPYAAGKRNALTEALNRLKKFAVGRARPFSGLKILSYSVNSTGPVHSLERGDHPRGVSGRV